MHAHSHLLTHCHRVCGCLRRGRSPSRCVSSLLVVVAAGGGVGVVSLVAVLVSVSTALVGPVTFFGLLVASLAVALVGSRRHAETLIAASLIAVICLVGGQTILERVLGFDTALGIVVEFFGGIVFLAIVLKRGLT